MKILVTGGAGFLGRHVVERLLATEQTPLVLSRDPERAADALPPGVRCVAGDLTRPDALLELLETEAPEAVVHCAAIVSNDDPGLVGVNVGGTRSLVEQLQRAPGPPRLVYVSTFAVEDTPPTEYSESKLAAEEVVKASGLPFVIARPTLPVDEPLIGHLAVRNGERHVTRREILQGHRDNEEVLFRRHVTIP